MVFHRAKRVLKSNVVQDRYGVELEGSAATTGVERGNSACAARHERRSPRVFGRFLLGRRRNHQCISLLHAAAPLCVICNLHHQMNNYVDPGFCVHFISRRRSHRYSLDIDRRKNNAATANLFHYSLFFRHQTITHQMKRTICNRRNR